AIFRNAHHYRVSDDYPVRPTHEPVPAGANRRFEEVPCKQVIGQPFRIPPLDLDLALNGRIVKTGALRHGDVLIQRIVTIVSWNEHMVRVIISATTRRLGPGEIRGTPNQRA